MEAIKPKINLEPLMSLLDPFGKMGDLLKPFLTLFPDIGYPFFRLRPIFIDPSSPLFA